MPRKKKNSNAGINFNKANRKYYARIYHDGREHYVGSFATKKEAIEERNAALIRIESTGFSGGYTRNRSKKGRPSGSDPWTVLDSSTATSFGNPEHVIRYKVLLGAIEDLEKPESRNVYKGALDWFNGRKVYPKGYSFDEICDIFRLNPEAVRDALRRKLNNVDLV